MRRILLLEARDDGTPLEDVTLTEAVQGSLSLAADACEVFVFRGDHARPLKHRDDALEDVAVAIQRREVEAQPSYPAELLDLLATRLAQTWEHLVDEDDALVADVLQALDRYSAEVGRENVPAAVDRAIAGLA